MNIVQLEEILNKEIEQQNIDVKQLNLTGIFLDLINNDKKKEGTCN